MSQENLIFLIKMVMGQTLLYIFCIFSFKKALPTLISSTNCSIDSSKYYGYIYVWAFKLFIFDFYNW